MTDPRASTGAAEVSLVGLLSLALRHSRLLVGLPIACALLAVPVTLLLPRRWAAATTFVAESGGRMPRLPSALLGLASQLNLDFGGSAMSPRFYAELVTSRELLDRALTTRFADPRAPGDSATLLTILRVRGESMADSLERGRRRLSGFLSVRVNAQTSIVRLELRARSPELAADVANAFVGYINDFNTRYRQSQARERRRFTEEQAQGAERELRAAEDRLRSFFERNRLWEQSSQLRFEEGRLRRQVEVFQEVYLTLRREFETARVEEVNDTPVITVIDRAVPPVKKAFPKRRAIVMGAALFGFVVALVLGLLREYLGVLRRTDAAAYGELVANLKSATPFGRPPAGA